MDLERFMISVQGVLVQTLRRYGMSGSLVKVINAMNQPKEAYVRIDGKLCQNGLR